MGKRKRLSSIYLKQERENYLEDRISQLPDGVLISIISLLTIREAARTSVLSHRWEKLWTFTGSLNFDARKTMLDIEQEPMSLETERSKYISWVNQALDSFDGSTLDAFRIRFDLDKGSRDHIDRWIEFAIKKRVQRLELNLKPVAGGITDISMRYTFPLEYYARMKQPCGLYSIKSLTSLCLKFVNVSGEVVEFFLSSCPCLERLRVVASEQLVNLRVSGSSLGLKYLDISRCYSMETIEISAPNLVALKYFGKGIKLHVNHAPQLVELCVGGGYRGRLIDASCLFSSYLCQLETLKLEVGFEVYKEFTQLHKFSKLKHLILRVTRHNVASLLGWTDLMMASPFLHRITLELLSFGALMQGKIQNATKCPHQSLKVVELIGFTGCPLDVELVIYLLNTVCTLETIIIDRRSPFSLGKPWEFEETKGKMAAKECAMQLARSSPNVKFVII